MISKRINRPAEIFGFTTDNFSEQANRARQNHLCPFKGQPCNKKSRLLDIPFGVCTVQHNDDVYSICPVRFQEQGSIQGIPRVLEDVALHYFGDFNNVIPFSEVRLPNIGTLDFVLVRHKQMMAEVEDFVMVEFQSDSTTGTGHLVVGFKDLMNGTKLVDKNYSFGMNTYDTIKRSMTQLFNKGMVYERWGVKTYWVMQEYIYQNLVNRYGLKEGGYSSHDASRFALYSFVPSDSGLTLKATRYVSTSVDEVYQAMRGNPGLPEKDKFIEALNFKLKAHLRFEIEN